MTNLIARAIELEEDGDFSAAAAIYEKALLLDSDNKIAHVNLGTIRYNNKNFLLAMLHYRAVVAIDPSYALGHFDYANVLDELGQHELAIEHYLTAIELAPDYADAHYNLALACQAVKKSRMALTHWRKYMRLDPDGPFHSHASTQVKNLMKADLQLATNNPKPKRTKRTAKLSLC